MPESDTPAASRGIVSLGEAIVWTTGGSLAGALPLYGVGARVGRERVTRIAYRLPLVDAADIFRAERWFERQGTRAVLLGGVMLLAAFAARRAVTGRRRPVSMEGT